MRTNSLVTSRFQNSENVTVFIFYDTESIERTSIAVLKCDFSGTDQLCKECVHVCLHAVCVAITDD